MKKIDENNHSKFSLLETLKKALVVLKDTPEDWLHFSAGQNTKSNLSRSPDAPKASGLLPRIAVYFRWLLINSKKKQTKSQYFSGEEIYVFADSINQLTVLDPLVVELSSRNIPFQAIANFNSKPADHISSNWSHSYFKFRVIFLSILLSIYRFKSLYMSLKAKDRRLLKYRLNGFLTVYTWVVYFLDHMSCSRPSLVILGNDHNPSCRSLIAVCKLLSIKTAYLQHASVSGRFHELQFTYSFLDGEMSYQTYLTCEGRRSPFSNTPHDRSVFLSGIKRPLVSDPVEKSSIGVAFKEADGYENLRSLVNELADINPYISIRCHPSTRKSVIDKIEADILTESIRLSDPKKQSVESYCNSLFLLICGNSSIHVEAAVCGISSVYFEMDVQYASDYYSFVENGVCHAANSLDELTNIVKQAKAKKLAIKSESVRLYSETFGTKWQGKESELVADHLVALLNRVAPEELWGYRKMPA